MAKLKQINSEQDRALDIRALDINVLEDKLDGLAQQLADTDCGSAQLNRTAATCHRHETCLTCERDELRAELEKVRKQERRAAA